MALDVIEGVSLLDNVSTLLGADFGTNGVQLLDCRRYCRDALRPDPQGPSSSAAWGTWPTRWATPQLR